jgi:pilus assembly protein Flp/PilA
MTIITDRPRLRRRRDEDGASAVEYGFLVVAIAAGIVLVVFALGGVVNDTFGAACDSVNSASFSHSASSC